MRTQNKRPLGITLLSILLIVNSITSVPLALYRILSGSSLVLERALLLPKYFLIAQDVFSIIFGIWIFSLAIGLWNMWTWSWMAALITQAAGGLIAILSGIFGWLRGDLLRADFFTLIASLLIFSLGIIYYLLRPRTKAAFHIN